MAYGLTQSVHLVRASTQYLSAADSASLSVTGNISIEFWIKLTALSSTLGAQQTLISKSKDAGVNRSFTLALNTSDKLIFNYSQDGNFTPNNTNCLSDAAFFVSGDIGAWVHVAVTATVATKVVTMYKNGSSVASTNTLSGASSIFNSDAQFQIGNDSQDNALIAGGDFSLVRLWATVRSGANILSAMCSVLGSTTNLQGEWTLDNVLTDNSGNSNTLTNNNSATFTATVPSVCMTTLSNVKTINGLAVASVKTINGLAIASVKSWNGLT